MEDLKCKKCRRAGQKLFLKKERCYSVKCSMVRKPYPPGILGKSGGKHPKRGLSEYGTQLKEKQRIKFNYGLKERQFANYVKKISEKGKKDKSSGLYELLELRLDNVVCRSGFAGARTEARQMVSHGHIMVNGRKVNISSLQVKIGDKISIRPQSADKSLFKDIDAKLKKFNPLIWIKLDKEKRETEIIGKPLLSDEPGVEKNLNSIIEFYSR